LISLKEIEEGQWRRCPSLHMKITKLQFLFIFSQPFPTLSKKEMVNKINCGVC
jgi:hypothetical protein